MNGRHPSRDTEPGLQTIWHFSPLRDINELYMTILISGAAGFIGFHLAQALCGKGENVVGIDTLNDYYDPALKHDRLKILQQSPQFTFRQTDITDSTAIMALADEFPITHILHMAAQPGVRYSLENPLAYVSANIAGQTVMAELARRLAEQKTLRHFLYASSSSVYGGAGDSAEAPVSLYAASKRSAELIAHCYATLFDIPSTGLRFFTVYGPWGRPDMAYFSFTRDIIAQKPIKLFNNGNMKRSFTYIDDAVAAVLRLMASPPESSRPRLRDVGNPESRSLLEFVKILEQAAGHPAIRENMPMQPGDVTETRANPDSLKQPPELSFPTSIDAGLPIFVQWFREHYGV